MFSPDFNLETGHYVSIHHFRHLILRVPPPFWRATIFSRTCPVCSSSGKVWARPVRGHTEDMGFTRESWVLLEGRPGTLEATSCLELRLQRVLIFIFSNKRNAKLMASWMQSQYDKCLSALRHVRDSSLRQMKSQMIRPQCGSIHFFFFFSI